MNTEMWDEASAAKAVGPITRLPRYKFVMVSIGYRGHTKTVFCHLPVGDDGKMRFNYNDLAETIGVPRGCTYTLG